MKKCNHSTSDFTNETRSQTQWELNQGIHPTTPKTKVCKVSIACMLNQGWNKAQNSAPSQSTGDGAWSRAGACMSKSGKAFLRLSLLVLSAQWEAGARCILMPLATTRDAELDYFLFWGVTDWMLWSTYLAFDLFPVSLMKNPLKNDWDFTWNKEIVLHLLEKEMNTGFFAWWIIYVDQYVMAVCGPVQVDRNENTWFCIALFCTTKFVMLCGIFSLRVFQRFQSWHWSHALVLVLYVDMDTSSVTSLCVDGLKASAHADICPCIVTSLRFDNNC